MVFYLSSIVVANHHTIGINIGRTSITARFQNKARETDGNHQDIMNDASEDYLLDY